MHRAVRTNSTIGTHSSSRAVGRVVAGEPWPVAGPGDAEAPGPTPSPSIAAAEPGAIVDSSTSKRATAKRTGAFGSTGCSDGAAEPPGPADAPGLAPVVGVGRAVGPEPLPDGAAADAGARCGVTT